MGKLLVLFMLLAGACAPPAGDRSPRPAGRAATIDVTTYHPEFVKVYVSVNEGTPLRLGTAGAEPHMVKKVALPASPAHLTLILTRFGEESAHSWTVIPGVSVGAGQRVRLRIADVLTHSDVWVDDR